MSDDICARIFYDTLIQFVWQNLEKEKYNLQKSQSEQNTMKLVLEWSVQKRKEGWQALLQQEMCIRDRAHSVLILSLVIAFGIMLGKVKIAGISLGVTWILFVGIVFGHFNLNLDEHLLHFLKEFGLILFVYSIGLQVGPGFFSAFKKGGFTLNMLCLLYTSFHGRNVC